MEHAVCAAPGRFYESLTREIFSKRFSSVLAIKFYFILRPPSHTCSGGRGAVKVEYCYCHARRYLSILYKAVVAKIGFAGVKFQKRNVPSLNYTE